MKNKLFLPPCNEEGFVLVVALLFLVILTLIGTFALNTTTLETEISGSDRLNKLAFYGSDGGIQAGIDLVEENVSCATGFSSTTTSIGGIDIADATEEDFDDDDKDFAFNEAMKDVAGAEKFIKQNNSDDDALLNALPSDDIRSMRIADDAANRNDDDPHVNLAIWGVTSLISGNAIQMAAGYEGKGKSAADGGSVITYQVHSQYKGVHDTETKLAAQWLHVVGQEGSCKY